MERERLLRMYQADGEANRSHSAMTPKGVSVRVYDKRVFEPDADESDGRKISCPEVNQRQVPSIRARGGVIEDIFMTAVKMLK
jgi:hypothetical protein